MFISVNRMARNVIVMLMTVCEINRWSFWMFNSFMYAWWTCPGVEVYIKRLFEVSVLFVGAVPRKTWYRVLSGVVGASLLGYILRSLVSLFRTFTSLSWSLLLHRLPDSANLVSKNIDIRCNQPVCLLKGVWLALWTHFLILFDWFGILLYQGKFS